MENEVDLDFLMHELDIASFSTILELSNFWMEVCKKYLFRHPIKISRIGITVEIHEFYLVKRIQVKRLVNEAWVLKGTLSKINLVL